MLGPKCSITVNTLNSILYHRVAIGRKNIILVVYNRLSKMIHFITMIKKTSAKELVWLFWDNV